MTTATLTDDHFLARMEQATSEERDAVFAELARDVDAGSELAARTIRQLLLPTCRRIAGGHRAELLADVVDAAYDEVLDWARTLSTVPPASRAASSPAGHLGDNGVAEVAAAQPTS